MEKQNDLTIHKLRVVKTSLVIYCFVLLVVSFSDLDAQQPFREIDLRALDSSSQTFVAFCSRLSPGSSSTGAQSFPGHAFVVIGTIEKDGTYKVNTALGMYKNNEKTESGAIPSSIAIESLKSAQAGTCTLIARIDQSQLQKVGVTLNAMQHQAYSLTESDCVTLVGSVASNLGLVAPDRKGLDNLPINYIQALAIQNGTKEQLDKFPRERQKFRRKELTQKIAVQGKIIAHIQESKANWNRVTKGHPNPSFDIDIAKHQKIMGDLQRELSALPP